MTHTASGSSTASLPTRALPANFASLSLIDRVRLIGQSASGVVFTTSFGLEDQAITQAIARSGAAIAIVTLDTGRLFSETLDLWAETEARYGLRITGYAPDQAAVEALVARDGVLGFRHAVEARKSCCAVRKLEPLGRALAGAGGWVTGLRAQQSAFRADTGFTAYDAVLGIQKFNPMADWQRADVERYIAAYDIPYNVLHDRGFASIGCAPCTRAVRVGEDERAGRWWWEIEDKKECGLHARPGFPARVAALAEQA